MLVSLFTTIWRRAVKHRMDMMQQSKMNASVARRASIPFNAASMQL
jgi:hypothetical protein